MNKLISKDYLSIVHASGLMLMVSLIIYTLIKGESPFETLEISPLAATIGTVLAVILLVILPKILRKR